MPHRPALRTDRQLQLIVGLWALMLVNAAWSGFTLPSSDLVTFSPNRFSYLFPLSALLGPPVLMAANHLFPQKWRWDAIDLGWLQRAIDRRFGHDTTITFWRRLRPLSFISASALILGTTGLIASSLAKGPPAAFEHSLTFLCFGVGFFSAMMLERYVFKVAHAA